LNVAGPVVSGGTVWVLASCVVCRIRCLRCAVAAGAVPTQKGWRES
jgi:hypothetical protein